MQSSEIQNTLSPFPALTTEETNRLRADYPCIEHLEAGNVAAWLMERQDQLLIRAKDERAGMNLAKLITIAGGAAGAICYATSPLAVIGGVVAGVGYVWSVAQDLNDSHQFSPLPFIKGNFFEFLSAMGDRDLREEWLANQNEIVDLMNHLVPMERYEFGMLKVHTHTLTDFLAHVDAGKKFYAYRWLLDWFINLKGEFPSPEMLYSHLNQVTADPRVNYQHVETIASHLSSTQAACAPSLKNNSLKSAQELLTPMPDSTENQQSPSNPLDTWLNEVPPTKTVEAEVVQSNAELSVAEAPVQKEAPLHPNPLIDQLARIILECLKVKRATCEFIGAVEGYKFDRFLFRKAITTNIDAVLNSDRDIFCEIGVLLPELNMPPMVSPVRGGRIAVDIPKSEKTWTTALFKNYIVPAVRSFEWPVNLIIGVNLDGVLVEMDISQDETCGMIVAGLPGGGKSVWLVAALCGVICQYTPDSVRLILSDTKRVELAPFQNIPHLFTPVAHTVAETVEGVNVAIAEMERRKVLFAKVGVKNLAGYNNKVPASDRLPRILVVIEESATTATSDETYVDVNELGNEVIRRYAEEFNKGKIRIKKEARFAGIYIIDSTQSPRREVLEPNYRGQFSCFLAFRCSRPEESKIALANQYEDACKLLGKGDGLYLNHLGLERIQSLLVDDDDVEAIVGRVTATYGTYKDWVAKERKRTQDFSNTGGEPRDVSTAYPGSLEVLPRYEDRQPTSQPTNQPANRPTSSITPSENQQNSFNPSLHQPTDQPTIQEDDLARFQRIKRGRMTKPPVSKTKLIQELFNIEYDSGNGFDRYEKQYYDIINAFATPWIIELLGAGMSERLIVEKIWSRKQLHADYNTYLGFVMEVKKDLKDWDSRN